MEVFDLRGRRIRTLGDADLDAAREVARWDGRTDAGNVAPGGVYFFRVGGGASGTGKLLRLF